MSTPQDTETDPRTHSAGVVSLRPRLTVHDAAAAIAFYVGALGAEEVERHTDDSGAVVHADLRLGEFTLSLKDEVYGDLGPDAVGGTPVVLQVESADVDALGARMEAAGATVLFPIADHDYGRVGRLRDPFGHVWMLFQAAPDRAGERSRRRAAPLRTGRS